MNEGVSLAGFVSGAPGGVVRFMGSVKGAPWSLRRIVGNTKSLETCENDFS